MNQTPFIDIAENFFDPNDNSDKNRTLKPILLIQRWLGHYEDKVPCYLRDENACRLAPSLISRSDAQLFGVSTPRFSVRLYVDGNRMSFINLRRTRLLETQFPGWSKIDDTILHRHGMTEDGAGTPPVKFAPVGDCFFEPPRRFVAHDKFRVITSKLGAAYGESNSADGTAFVRYSGITGICGHAACYIASAALAKYADGVHGLPEISALALDTDLEAFPIGALDFPEMIQYFRKGAGLNAMFQRCTQDDIMHRSAHEVYREALRSYVLSGMPVVLMVDLWRLNGLGSSANKDSCLPAIHDRKRTGFDLIGESPGVKAYEPSNHFVVVIGCSADPNVDTFLLHEPLSCPYLEASTLQLEGASPYDAIGGETNLRHLRKFTFLPVTPKQVRMPLHSHFSAESGAVPEPSLVEIVDWFFGRHKHDLLSKQGIRSPETKELRGRFRLCQLRRLDEVIHDSTWGIQHPLEVKELTAELQSVLIRNYGVDHWCWVQKCDSTVWIWDAQQPPPNVEDSWDFAQLTSLLFGVCGWQNGLPVFWLPRRSTAEPTGLDTQAAILVSQSSRHGLSVGIISSFDTNGLEHSFSWLRSGMSMTGMSTTNGCMDIYCFMQKDVNTLLPRFLDGIVDGKTAVEVMAANAHNLAGIQRLAEYLVGEVEKCGLQAKVPALATFIPELLDPDPKRSESGLNALKFAIRLAGEINKLRNEWGRVVEMVAGSSTDGVMKCQMTNDRGPAYLVKKLPEAVAIDRLLERLVLLREVLEPQQTRLAIELEPGPLYAINSLKSMELLAKRTAEPRYSEIAHLIGFNLDIGHWAFLCGMDTSLVKESKIFNRIFHAHISDHGVGHFGDAVVGSIHERPEHEFSPWLRLFAERHTMSLSDPSDFCTGTVSVELEAAIDAVSVAKSVWRTRNLLATL